MKKVDNELSVQVDEERIIKVFEVEKLLRLLTVKGKPDHKAWEVVKYLTYIYPDSIHFNELDRKLTNVSRVTLSRKLKMLIEKEYVTSREEEGKYNINRMMYRASKNIPTIIQDLYDSFYVKPKFIKELFNQYDIEALTIFFIEVCAFNAISQIRNSMMIPRDFSYLSRDGFFHFFDTICDSFTELTDVDKKMILDITEKIPMVFSKALIETFGEKRKITFPESVS